MEKKQAPETHRLLINGRKMGTVSGISDVLSFDEKEIVLDTDMGLLTIKGSKLHISRLTLEQGEADMEGKIDSLTYSERGHRKKREGSLISRMFQ